jgi:hypothetical protein
MARFRNVLFSEQKRMVGLDFAGFLPIMNISICKTEPRASRCSNCSWRRVLVVFETVFHMRLTGPFSETLQQLYLPKESRASWAAPVDSSGSGQRHGAMVSQDAFLDVQIAVKVVVVDVASEDMSTNPAQVGNCICRTELSPALWH